MQRLRVLKHIVVNRPSLCWYVGGRKIFCWRHSRALRRSLGLGNYEQ